MTALNGNIFRVTGSLCGEFTGHLWIPFTKASDAGLWCLLWSSPGQTVEYTMETLMVETRSCSLWRHCNDMACLVKSKWEKWINVDYQSQMIKIQKGIYIYLKQIFVSSRCVPPLYQRSQARPCDFIFHSNNNSFQFKFIIIVRLRSSM